MICSSIVAGKALLVRDPHWRGLVVELDDWMKPGVCRRSGDVVVAAAPITGNPLKRRTIEENEGLWILKILFEY
jgi:hypothetical protein